MNMIDGGGAGFYSVWNSTRFESMILSYEVAFDKDFDWVKGGKLPGLAPLSFGKGQGARQAAFLCYSSGTSGLPVRTT